MYDVEKDIPLLHNPLNPLLAYEDHLYICRWSFCVERKAMRIPNDMSLASYIRMLIRQDKVHLFYQTEEWKELRADVLEELHNECQDCLEHGRYTEADCVHHHNEVRERPDLALSKYYTDAEGNRQRQLIPLCNTCHNIRHEKLKRWQKEDKFTNEERW